MIFTTIFIGQMLISGGYFSVPLAVTWDFTHSHSSSIVGWPTDRTWTSRDWWASRNYDYKLITIIVAERPALVSINPPNVFFDRKGGELVLIKINEEPTTQVKALERLHSLAIKWGWPWNDATYTNWMRRINSNDTSGIGAGDRWDSKTVPRISAAILPAAASPDRPWFVQLHISWDKVGD